MTISQSLHVNSPPARVQQTRNRTLHLETFTHADQGPTLVSCRDWSLRYYCSLLASEHVMCIIRQMFTLARVDRYMQFHLIAGERFFCQVFCSTITSMLRANTTLASAIILYENGVF